MRMKTDKSVSEKIGECMGINLGTAMAVVISWSLYKSVWWAFCHGIFGWFYVIYYLFTR